MTRRNITLVLFAGVLLAMSCSVFAARQDKTLVCHVGSEYGPAPEYAVYMDDPGCVPLEENGYFCPDAGKIDLIEVAKANKHLNNPNHAFEYAPGEFVSDYDPDPAWGGSKEDTDGDGIDQGCQPELLTCPCWDTYSEEELLAALEAEAWTIPHCLINTSVAQAVEYDPALHLIPQIEGNRSENRCILSLGSSSIQVDSLPSEENEACYLETVIIMSQLTACQGANPGLAFDKQVTAVDAAGDGVLNAVGDVINYALVVTNTGNVPLTNVVATDPLTGTNVDVGDLLPGASITVDAFYAITQADLDSNGGGDGDIDNTATVDSDQTPPAEDSEEVPVTGFE